MDRSVQEMHHLVEELVEAPPPIERPLKAVPPRPVLVGAGAEEN